MTIDDVAFVLGSDVQRDGMFLELQTRADDRILAEVFYSDETKEFVVSLYEEDIPMVILEELFSRAKQGLPET